jgi:HAE1 family hydrophobic/amphiphilic exporter-1
MQNRILSDGLIRKAGAALVALAVLAPAGAFAGEKRRKQGYPGQQQQAQTQNQGQQPIKPDGTPATQDEVAPIQNPLTPDAQLTAPTPLIQFKDVPETRVGVDMNNVLSLTLQDAVAMALQRNLDIESQRIDTQVALFDYEATRSPYDFNLSGDFGFTSSTFPVARTFEGGGADAAISQKFLDYSVGFSQLFSDDFGFLDHGGSVTGSFNNRRSTTDSLSSTLNPTNEPSLQFNFTQPLLRNFKIDIYRRQIKLAKKNLDLSDSLFRQRVIETINQVQRTYWDLVYALRNEQIQRESVQLALVQLDNNLKQVEAGTLAPIELRSTEADLELRKVQVISAMQNITTTENVLKGLIIGDPNDTRWSARVVPADPANFSPVEPDLESSLRAAIVNRPELEQLKIQTQLRGIDLDYYKDQLKPQLDFIANYNLQGLAGTPATFDGTPIAVPNQFVGGFGRSLGTLFSADFPTWSVGVRFTFPVQNTLAEANYGRTKAELRQLDARQRKLIETIQVDVRNALQAVVAAKQRYEAAQAARVAAEAQLRGEEERFRAGLSTNFLVLDRQNVLSSARGSEAQALTDYNKALADLQRVTGTTIVANNVKIEETKQ